MIPQKIQDMMLKLEENGFEAYIIGGAVRDYFLNKEPKDRDIFTNASGEQILSIFPEGKVIGDEERQAKILTVIVDGVEISQFRLNGNRLETGKTLIEHLGTCDLTINALAWDRLEKLIDPYDGFSDILNLKVKAVGSANKRLSEDKLRAFRAIRFQAMLDGYMDSELLEAIKVLDISDIPTERIREELLDIVQYEKGMELLYSSGLLLKTIPELIEVEKLEGGKLHAEIVLDHMLYCFRESTKVTNNHLLRLACFLHDIGKGRAATVDEIKGLSFPAHHHLGAKMVEHILIRLNFSNNEIAYIKTLVDLHMFEAFISEGLSRKTARKLIKNLTDAGSSVEDLITLRFCDLNANRRREKIKFCEFIKENDVLRTCYGLTSENMVLGPHQLKIGGKELIELGMKPGPEMGTLLLNLADLVNSDKILNERNALIEKAKALSL